MTVTVEEFQITSPAASSSGSIPLTSTLVSSDLVLIVHARNSGSASGSRTIGGSSPTFYQEWTNVSGPTAVYTATGLTGSHTLSYTVGISSTQAYAVYVVRGLTNPAITATAESTWTTGFSAINADEFTTTAAVDSGQAVVAIGNVQGGGTATFPSNPTPSTGWTADNVASGGGTICAASRVFTALEGSTRMGIRSSLSGRIASVMLILGDAAGGPTPLTSTFVGWGNPIF